MVIPNNSVYVNGCQVVVNEPLCSEMKPLLVFRESTTPSRTSSSQHDTRKRSPTEYLCANGW